MKLSNRTKIINFLNEFDFSIDTDEHEVFIRDRNLVDSRKQHDLPLVTIRDLRTKKNDHLAVIWYNDMKLCTVLKADGSIIQLTDKEYASN